MGAHLFRTAGLLLLAIIAGQHLADGEAAFVLIVLVAGIAGSALMSRDKK